MWMALLFLAATRLVVALAQAKILIHESPYFLPGVTNASFGSFKGDDIGGGTFRVFGVQPDSGLFGDKVVWEQAQKACEDVGLGLAAITSKARKDALDAAMLASWEFDGRQGREQSFRFWIGGYNTQQPACDWVWDHPSADNICWSDLDYAQIWWGTEERTGKFQGDPQPTGYNGVSDELCLVAHLLTRDDEALLATAADQAWYEDWGCLGDQLRWVCEMEDATQNVDEDALLARGPAATVTASPFYINGVTDEVVKVDSNTFFRVFGILPEHRDRFKAYGEAAIGSIPWQDAQKACQAAGGFGLASNSDPDESSGRATLLNLVGDKLSPATEAGVSSAYVWLGGATTASPDDSLSRSSFAWFSAGDDAGAAFNAFHNQWDVGYPMSGIEHVALAGEAGTSSCVASLYKSEWVSSKPVKSSKWQNLLCNDGGVHYFMCAFPSETTGVDDGTRALTPGSDEAPGGPGDTAVPGGVPPSPSVVVVKDDNTGVIISAIAAVAVLLAVLAGFVLLRRRRQRASESLHGADAKLPVTVGDANPKAHLANRDGAPNRRSGTPPGGALQVKAGGYAAHMASAHASELYPDRRYAQAPRFAPVTMTSTTTGPLTDYATHSSYGPTPAAYATVTNSTQSTDVNGLDPLKRLHAQLDGLLARGRIFAKKYVLGDNSERRQGGQGVVQMARGRFNGFEYAIKFFLHENAFMTERALYNSTALQRILPNIEDISDPTDPETDPHGNALPPYIVMERGEALDEWSLRANPDMPTTVQVLSHLATRLADVHAAGMAHRDLKPGNVMWLPRENCWTIIDFGCVAKVGAQAPISFSLSYAAPEVIAAYDASHAGTGPHNMTVTPALDAWSLGVMIFRMVTTKRGERMGDRKITIEQLRGEELLPWEGSNLTPDNKRRLGVLKNPVLKLLSRDPSLRPSMQQLKAQCDAIFAGHTTIASSGTDESGV